MPKRTDIQSILLIGSGPIVIGQACEFDYSGTQACKALKEEGYRVILVNSNPATIMTDPEFADVTYIEPLTVEALEKIIARERPQALLPTLGGQTGLNLAVELAKAGVLQRYQVELIGATLEAIERGENRDVFRQLMVDIGLDIPRSHIVHTLEEAQQAAQQLGSFPLIIRPSFTLGGAGGGIAYNKEEYEQMIKYGLSISPTHEVLVEECLLGWKEYEMEVMQDSKNQCIVICGIENFDPMGVHTGDSITVAPTMTLSDADYQRMRNASFAVIRAVGVRTGGSNIQFAVHPETGRMIVIEMNPRVSRSSALASKATGYPIAKIAAKLAVGYTLDELPNDITRSTTACFEPTIDYVVTKIPRFTFEKFPGADTTLTSAMKSVGEAMGIGQTFKASFQKALRSLEIGCRGFGGGGTHGDFTVLDEATILAGLAKPTHLRPFFVRYALIAGMTVEAIYRLTYIDRWFLHQLSELVEMERQLRSLDPEALSPELLAQAKDYGFSDLQLGDMLKVKPYLITQKRKAAGLHTVYRMVDTCGAEFEARTPYYYSASGSHSEHISRANDVTLAPEAAPRGKILIIGGGPNRIGQGIEFDYCCVHASFALREKGYEAIMINSNPETVSTDYDTSSKLYFEPLTLEDVLAVYHAEGCSGAIVQFGGQTPLNLALELKENGVHILGTSPEALHKAEDRSQFKAILDTTGLLQPANQTALCAEEAYEVAGTLGFPVLIRPSFVLGGRGMFIVHTLQELKQVVREAFDVAPGKPVLIEQYLENAIEVDVDCLSDGSTCVIGGILEHIEYAGVHSGDATLVLPTYTLSPGMLQRIRQSTEALAKALGVIGLMNVQYAIQGDKLYVLEVNPRASRTVPFVSKAIGVPLAKYAARVMSGETLEQIGFTQERVPGYWAVKESVFPFARFPGSHIILSPEMKSTGEVMGIDASIGMAFAKAKMAAQPPYPTSGNAFLSVRDADKAAIVPVAQSLVDLGFQLYATRGTAEALREQGLVAQELFKISEGARPNVEDLIKNDAMHLIINTATGAIPHRDESAMRYLAIQRRVCMIMTLSGAQAAVTAIRAQKSEPLTVKPIQAYYTA